MREMKDSGVEWIGKIPAHWIINRGKYVFDYLQKPVKPTDEVITCFRDGEVTLRSNRREEGFTFSEKEIGYQGVDIGDLVIHGMDGFAGAIGISDSRGKASPVLNVLGTDQNKRYYMYYLRAMAFTEVFTATATGIRVRSCDLRWNKLAEFPYPVPPIYEQERITSFLDSKCAEIDSISEDIRKEIETLQEYRKSIITEAVTKGLDPNAEMKDSGVEWIGMIPNSWELEKGKYVFIQKNERGNTICLQLLSPTQKYGVIPQDKYEELSGMKAVKLNEKVDLSELKTVHKGAFCISLRSFQGGFEYSDYEGVVSPAYQIFYPTRNICDDYYRYLFKTQGFIQEMNSFTMSLRDGKNIAFEDFGNSLIPVPPLSIQNDIATFLNTKCSEIDSIIADKQKQLDVLAEYRKSLIYEYVTGKKEVPTK
ncbi:MAG: restriction endonuclease subunit S [Candidatus Ornithospirochaeta sp.]